MFIEQINCNLLKKVIVIFWTVWWGLVFWYNIFGVFVQFNYINGYMPFNLNYEILKEVLSRYNLNESVTALLYSFITFWCLLIFLLFTMATININQAEARWMKRAEAAFVLSITFWFAFFLADKIFMKYELEKAHMLQGGFQLISLIALFTLPSNSRIYYLKNELDDK